MLAFVGVLAKRANMSQAIVTSMICTAPFITAIIFYFFYKEKLLTKHLIGMISLLLGVILILLTKVFAFNSNNAVDDV
jgi:drug/metabolite transporter (DMT)-like permease